MPVQVFKASVHERRGRYARPAFLVAVKTLKEGCTGQDKKELMEEAALMAHLRHDNLVELVGVCTREYPVLLVME